MEQVNKTPESSNKLNASEKLRKLDALYEEFEGKKIKTRGESKELRKPFTVQGFFHDKSISLLSFADLNRAKNAAEKILNDNFCYMCGEGDHGPYGVEIREGPLQPRYKHYKGEKPIHVNRRGGIT